MDRRQFLQTSIGAAWTLALGKWLPAGETVASRPNVLFIPVDDLKPLLGCYGASHIHTPNIDRLASRGMVFDNAQCQQAICAPSRVSLLTGLYPDSTGVHDLKTKMRDVHPDVVTLPQYFRQHGYATAGAGKTFDYRAVDDGHDSVSWSRGYHRDPHERLNPECPLPVWGYQNPQAREKAEQVNRLIRECGATGRQRREIFQEVPGSRPAFESADVPDDAYMDGAIASYGVQQLEKFAAGDRPFFLSVGFFKPHLPFVAPKRYWDLYDREAIDVAAFQEMPIGAPQLAYQPGWELRAGYTGVPEGRLPEAYQKQLIHGYYACISYIDAQIGKLLDKLDELGLAQNTIICLWGDHGWHLGDHAMWCKHSNFEQAVRSPLMIAAPGMPQAGQHSRSVVGLIDIYPTLCALAGLPVPPHLQGESLQPILRDPSASVKDVQMSQFSRGHDGQRYMGYSLRNERYRATFWMPQDSGGKVPLDASPRWVELYDYQSDPLEAVNLADQPGEQKRLASFRQQLRQAMQGGRR